MLLGLRSDNDLGRDIRDRMAIMATGMTKAAATILVMMGLERMLDPSC